MLAFFRALSALPPYNLHMASAFTKSTSAALSSATPSSLIFLIRPLSILTCMRFSTSIWYRLILYPVWARQDPSLASPQHHAYFASVVSRWINCPNTHSACTFGNCHHFLPIRTLILARSASPVRVHPAGSASSIAIFT